MVNWIVSSCVLIVAVVCLRRLCKGKISLRLQYAMWLLVAVRLLVPVNFGQSILSIYNIPLYIEEQRTESAVRVSEQWDLEKDYAGFYQQIIETYRNEIAGVADKVQAVTDESEVRKGAYTISEIGMVIWSVGVLLVFIVFIVTNILFRMRLKYNRIKLHVPYSKLPVYLSEKIETPCISGIIRTKIYVTKTVADNPIQLKHAVCHEKMHYRHGDLIWALVRCICLALHWYNPFVWLAVCLAKADAEFACDEAVILQLGEVERVEYGRTLIMLTGEKSHDVLLTTSAMTSEKRYMHERITYIAHKTHTKKYIGAFVFFAVVLLAGSTFTEASRYGAMEIGIGQKLEEIDWRRIKNDVGEAEKKALDKYRPALEGGQITWIGQMVPGGKEIADGTLRGQYDLQSYIDTKMRNMGLQTGDILIESFLFSDVFERGEMNVCLLLRHLGKNWVILHEEDGVIYGIELSGQDFKGVCENGVYYQPICAGVSYYKKMRFEEGNCYLETEGVLSDNLYEEEQEAEQVAIYTFVVRNSGK